MAIDFYALKYKKFLLLLDKPVAKRNELKIAVMAD